MKRRRKPARAAHTASGLDAAGRIAQPGMYLLPIARYHAADACAGPSLSSSDARRLEQTTPARFRAEKDAPAAEERPTREMLIGSAVHCAVLEPAAYGARILAVASHDYRDDWSRGERNRALAQGKIPLLIPERVQVEAMAAAIRTHPAAAKLLAGAWVEQTFAVQHEALKIWLRARPDAVTTAIDTIVDVKTLEDATDRPLAATLLRDGWHQQAAWNMDVVAGATGRVCARAVIVAQERSAPYAVRVIEIPEHAIRMGRTLNRRSMEIFARCTHSGEWPAFSSAIEEIELPVWAELDHEKRAQRGDFVSETPDAESIARAFAFQRPLN